MSFISYEIYSSLAGAQSLAASVDVQLGYPRAGVDVGGGRHVPPAQSVTLRYADVVAKPDGTAWAYPVDTTNQTAVTSQPSLTASATGITNLDATWQPTGGAAQATGAVALG